MVLVDDGKNICGVCGFEFALDIISCPRGHGKVKNMATITEEKLNWDVFETKHEDRLKLENGRKYELGFSGIRQETMDVEDREKTAEGMIPVKKTIPVLILAIDFRDGKPAKLELAITSKRFAQDIKTYFQKGMLFTRVFEISREGEGLSTKYRCLALNDKPDGKAGQPAPPKDPFC